MAFYSGFFNSKGLDRTYTAEDFTSYLSSIICNGIQDNYGDCFAITANGDLTVTIGSGRLGSTVIISLTTPLIRWICPSMWTSL